MHTTILMHHSVTMAINVTDIEILSFPYCYITAFANSSSINLKLPVINNLKDIFNTIIHKG